MSGLTEQRVREIVREEVVAMRREAISDLVSEIPARVAELASSLRAPPVRLGDSDG